MKEQEIVLDVINTLKPYLGNGVDDIIKKIKSKYQIEEKLPTLREYINEHAKGAYHRFIFEISYITITVCDVYDFESFYNKDLLDQYYVTGDKKEYFGNNCTNYECRHHLTLERIKK